MVNGPELLTSTGGECSTPLCGWNVRECRAIELGMYGGAGGSAGERGASHLQFHHGQSSLQNSLKSKFLIERNHWFVFLPRVRDYLKRTTSDNGSVDNHPIRCILVPLVRREEIALSEHLTVESTCVDRIQPFLRKNDEWITSHPAGTYGNWTIKPAPTVIITEPPLERSYLRWSTSDVPSLYVVRDTFLQGIPNLCQALYGACLDRSVQLALTTVSDSDRIPAN